MRLLLPFLIALLAAGLLAARRSRAGRRIAWSALLLLALLSTPMVSQELLSGLEPPYNDPLARPADAIVVIGAGTYFNAPEYGQDTVNAYALERLRYAALLQRKTGQPLLVSGGNPAGNPIAEAAQMKATLDEAFHVPVQWSEESSANTLENARNSYAILSAAGIRRIYLVTHAWHMRRARYAFERAGFDVIPAPTRYSTRFRITWQSFVPSSIGLAQSSIFCQETVALAWYRWLLG
jgi:uncharacterized SAM-binding protein YcdF (DUF218 family)